MFVDFFILFLFAHLILDNAISLFTFRNLEEDFRSNLYDLAIVLA